MLLTCFTAFVKIACLRKYKVATILGKANENSTFKRAQNQTDLLYKGMLRIICL